MHLGGMAETSCERLHGRGTSTGACGLISGQVPPFRRPVGNRELLKSLRGFSIHYSTGLTCILRLKITQNHLDVTWISSLKCLLLWSSWPRAAFWVWFQTGGQVNLQKLSLNAGYERLSWKAYSNKKYPVLYLEAHGELSTQAKCYVFQLSNKTDLHRSKEEIRHFTRLFLTSMN